MTLPIPHIPATIEALEKLYQLRDLRAMDKAAKRAQIIPAEIQQELDALDDEYQASDDRLSEKIEELEAALKEQAVIGGSTIQGEYLQVIYTPGGKSVSAKDLAALATRWEKTNPEVAAEMRAIVTIKKSSARVDTRKGG